MKRVLLGMIGALFLLWGAPMNTMAKTEIIEISVAEESVNYVFQIKWENTAQTAKAELTAPDGTVLSSEQAGEADSGAYVSEGMIVFSMEKAMSGIWQVAVTGEALGLVQVDGGRLPGSMEIEEFRVESRQDTLAAVWKVTDAEPGLNFRIYADTDAEGFDGQEIASFSGEAQGEQTINLSSLDTGEYFFYLRVSGSQGIYTKKYAEGTCSVTGSNAAAPLSNVRACMMNGEVFLRWEMAEAGKSYKVMIYDTAAGGLIHEEIVQDTDTFLWTLPQQYKEAEAAVALYDRGTGRYEKYPVKRSAFPEVEIQFPEADVSNSSTVLVPVTFSGNYKISAALNGSMVMEDQTLSGQYRLDMGEGDNTILFYVQDEQGNLFPYRKELQVDTISPNLSLVGELNGLRTSKRLVYLEGHSEQGARLTVNDQEAVMNNGYFSVPVELKAGKNEITVSAKDAAGNETVYHASVTRSMLAGTGIYLLGIGGIFLLLCIPYSVLFVRGIKNRKKASGETEQPSSEDKESAEEEPDEREQAGGEPAEGERVEREQTGGEPVKGEPVEREQAGGEPVEGEPVANEPAAGEAVQSEPITSEPAGEKPAGGDEADNEEADGESTDRNPDENGSAGTDGRQG